MNNAKPVTTDTKNEERLLVEKIHRLLNKFHDKTGATVVRLETEYEGVHKVIHYRTALEIVPEE